MARPNPFVVILFSFSSLLIAGSVHAQSAVDFIRDVQPLLKEHCWKCHGENKAAGGLRLDTRKFAEVGGGSGKNLLELAGDKNELLLRVKSAEDGVRMPPDEPLLAEQIATLERWIYQGANWPVTEPPTNAPSRLLQMPSKWQNWFDLVDYLAAPRYQVVCYAAIVVAVAMLVVERSKNLLRRPAANESQPTRPWVNRLASPSRAWYVVGVLGVALFAAIQYSREQQETIVEVQRRADARLARVMPPAETRVREPFRPQHARRLGGTYYRGNDERSEELYNGGFYRTATFLVHLTDAEGNQLAWGDAMPERPHIFFEIKRAAHASPSLFAPAIMDEVGLCSVHPEQNKTAGEIPFVLLQTQEKGERWNVNYPLEAIPASGKLSGKLYVYKRPTADPTHKSAEISYMIGYELIVSDGMISPQSQIWMASVHNVAQMIWPEPQRIPADHWFDFRPIPEIEK